MIRSLAAVAAFAATFALSSFASAPSASAQEVGSMSEGRSRIGYGNLITNDLIGDGKDRWRTGSIASSRLWGYGWGGQAPAGFGELLELRILGQIMAPSNLRNPATGDRPWAGALSIGLHTHMQRDELEIALGGDLVFVGPQTGLFSFQDALHDLVGTTEASEATRTAQIQNTLRPTLVGELGRTVDLSERTRLRPFVEARLGDESLVRIGADLTIGNVGLGELLVRDPVTGQRYRTMYDDTSLSWTVGADVAHVASSVYLPKGRGYDLEHQRHRLRAGLHWQSGQSDLFYGVTYLSEELSTQAEGQLVGSIRLRLRF